MRELSCTVQLLAFNVSVLCQEEEGSSLDPCGGGAGAHALFRFGLRNCGCISLFLCKTNVTADGISSTITFVKMASTCLRVSQGLIPSFRGIVRRKYLSANSVGAVRSVTTSTDEKAAPPPPELSENEKKLSSEIESLSKDVETFKEKISDLDDKYKRSLADTENMRKRLTKQIEDAKLFGIQGFCKDLLTVSDILQKATECVPAEELKTNSSLKNLYEGLTMTEGELQKVFKRHGLVPVSPLGEKFNPNHHEALFEQPVEGKEPGTVIAVTKIGYKLHERIVRPAMVGVAK